MNSEIVDKVLNKIKEEQVKPTPRWQFVLHNWLIWSLGLMALLVGALAFSVIIFMEVNTELWLAPHVGRGRLTFLLVTLPYAWIILLVLFVLLADYQLRSTKHGYKWGILWITTGSMLASAVLGVLFYMAGIGQSLDRAFLSHVPYYETIGNRRSQIMLQPEMGVVGGVIINVVDDDDFEMRSVDRTLWVVDSSDATLIGPVKILPGEHVIVVGKGKDDFEDNIIRAEFIKELNPAFRQPFLKTNMPEKEIMNMRTR